ncbi:hypothetical protein WBG78_03385 [Chryseolinea sp. T2]|uniref:hypothetical protein n=1 Tax=Chryseolinea sp. T2 TaxID=3129255 RepID=UPI003077841E
MNYIEKQLLLSSAVKAIDFLGSTTSQSTTPLSRFKFEEESLSANGADPMQTLDLLHQQAGYTHEQLGEFALCMAETVTPALATNWLISSWNLRLRSQMLSNRDVLARIKSATGRWLRQLLPVDAESSFHFLPDRLTANFRAIAIARDALLEQMHWDTAARGMFNAPSISIVASSALSDHAQAALSLAGFGRSNISYAPTLDDGTIDMDKLPAIHERTILYLQAMHPITGAIENDAVIQFAKSRGAWVHVDAPVTLWMNLSANKRGLFSGYHHADSWVTDTNMWFESPEELGILACKQMHKHQGVNPMLQNRDSAMTTLWASLRSLGQSGLQSRIVRTTVYSDYIAQKLAECPVEVSGGGQACFVLLAFEVDEMAKLTCESLIKAGAHEVGLVYWRGKMRVRIPLLSWKQTPEWIESMINIIRDIAGTRAQLASAS